MLFVGIDCLICCVLGFAGLIYCTGLLFDLFGLVGFCWFVYVVNWLFKIDLHGLVVCLLVGRALFRWCLVCLLCL